MQRSSAPPLLARYGSSSFADVPCISNEKAAAAIGTATIGEGYICLEPQNCLANCQNSPFSREEAGFDHITPYALKTYRSKIYLDKI